MKAPLFSDTISAYTLSDTGIHKLPTPPKHLDIISLPPSTLLHSAIEIDKKDMDKLPALLYTQGRESGILSLRDESYTCHYTIREHLFDEQKCVCESFFCPCEKVFQKARVLTSDIFLPLALPCHKDFIVLIPPFLCYFENGTLKEALQAQHIESSQDLASLIAYIQEAHHQHFDCVYYFTDDMLFLESIHASAPDSAMPALLPLSEMVEGGNELDFKLFRAFLAFKYALAHHDSLPNLAKKPSLLRRFCPALIACIALIVVIIPISLQIYNHHLQSQISALNIQNETLFSSLDSQEGAKDTHTLTLYHNALLAELEELRAWQHNYAKRYAFMDYIFSQCTTNHVDIQSLSFAFTQHHFIATIRFKNSSKLHTSALLSKLNSSAQYAFLEPLDRELDSQAISQIIVVQNAL